MTWWRGLLRRSKCEEELEKELSFHLEQHTRDLMAEGHSREEARRQARLALGGPEQVKEMCRDARGVRPVEDLWQDLKYGARTLRKNPGFALVAVVTLALGIGANTAIFSVVHGVLLRPLPYKDSARILRVWRTPATGGALKLSLSEPEFLEYRSQSQSFDQAAAFATGALNLTGAGEPERIIATWASADLFPLLGVRPLLGRPFSADEDRLGHHLVAVLSHRLWLRRFGGDPTLVGKTVTLNGRSRVVIGIMPPDFKFPTDDVEMWVPLALEPASRELGNRYLDVVAHLRQGYTEEQARAELKTVAARIAQKYPEYYKDGAEPTVGVMPLREYVIGDTRTALLVLLGGVGFMLLIACANVANLSLARAASRKKEIATRTAFGASRMRVVRQLLTESLLLFALGGALGLLLALWGVRAIISLNPVTLPRMSEVRVDLWVLAFTALTSLLTGLIFGLAPALQASKVDLNNALKEGDLVSKGASGRTRAHKLLIVSEIALSVVLLAGAGLMVRSFTGLQRVRLGFDPEHVLTMQLSLPQPKYPEGRQVAAFYRNLVGRLKGLPGVESVAVTSQLPLAEVAATASFEIEGRQLERGSEVADFRVISPEYFHAMHIPLMQGRPFTEADGNQSPACVIVNQAMARKVWPGEDPTTKRLRLTSDAPWLPVIGVVADVKNHGPRAETKPEMYFPHAEAPFGLGPAFGGMIVVVRSASEPQGLVNSIRGEIWSADKELPVYEVQTMEQRVAASVSQTRFTTLLLSAFACLALLLAAVGVYGVMSYSVGQRTHEIGIRMALGAQAGALLRLVVGQGMVLVFTGIGVGLAGTWALTRLMRGLLFGVSATDPLTFILTALVLGAAALVACLVPAQRATKVDPITALRAE